MTPPGAAVADPGPLAGLVDSHCHLDDPRFDADRPSVLDRAWRAGLAAVVTVATGPATWDRVLALAEAEPRLHVVLGVHPHEAGGVGEGDWARLEALLGAGRVVAVGETGLDYYRDHSPRPAQREAFLRQVRVARARGLPLVVHNRDAHDDVLEVLEAEAAGRVPAVVLHCFSGPPDYAERAAALGFVLSFAGTVTFPGADALRQAARRVPADKLLLETDAPYLAPVPYRGRRNEPGHVRWVAAAVAAARGERPAAVAATAGANASRIFGLSLGGTPWVPGPASRG